MEKGGRSFRKKGISLRKKGRKLRKRPRSFLKNPMAEEELYFEKVNRGVPGNIIHQTFTNISKEE
jgi:hypothetical protein